MIDDETIANISKRSLNRINEDVKEIVCYPTGSPELYYILKRLRQLYDEKADDSSESAYILHSVARGLIMHPSDTLMLSMVASPHMANFLFGDEEDLLNEKTRLVKLQLAKTNGRPTEEYIEAIEDVEAREELRKICDTYDELDSSWGEPSSMSFCYTYFNLIVACAIHCQRSHSSVHDGLGRLRGGDPRSKSPVSLMATAALRRAMELWTNKHVLASCGDAMAPAASLAMTAVQHYEKLGILGGPTCREYEIVPGLQFDSAVITCIGELLERAGSRQYSGKLLKDMGEKVEQFSFAWNELPIDRRAAVALAIVKYIMEDDGDDDDDFGMGFSNIEMPSASVNKIFQVMCAASDPKLRKDVLHKAADDGEYIGPDAAGQNVQTRAFIYYLIRADMPSDEWQILDAVKLAKDFSALPYIGRAPDDEKVKEKDECLRLSRGDKLHNEINEMLKGIKK